MFTCVKVPTLNGTTMFKVSGRTGRFLGWLEEGRGCVPRGFNHHINYFEEIGFISFFYYFIFSFFDRFFLCIFECRNVFFFIKRFEKEKNISFFCDKAVNI